MFQTDPLLFLKWGAKLAIPAAKMAHQGYVNANNREAARQAVQDARRESAVNRRVYTTDNFQKNNKLLFGGEQLLLLENSERDIFNFVGQSTINMIISGKNEDLRNMALAFACKDAYARSSSVLIVHCGNKKLQNSLTVGPIADKVLLCDGLRYSYNPFVGMSPMEIAEIVVNSIPDRYQVQPHFSRKLVEVASKLQLCQKKKFTLKTLSKTPLSNFIDVLDSKLQSRAISSKQHSDLLSEFASCQTECARLQPYLYDLKKQIVNITGKKTPILNLARALERNRLVMLDAGSSMNDLLIGLITEQLREMLRSGKRIVLVLDGIALSANPKLSQMLMQYQECRFAISSGDLFASLGSKEPEFQTLLGSVGRVALFEHDSPATCEQWSKYFGEYDNVEYLQGYSQSSGMVMGTTGTTQQPHKNKARRVRPEDLRNMTSTQMCVYNSDDKMIAFADTR